MSEKPISVNHFHSTLSGSEHRASKKPDLVRDIPRTIDLRPSANVFQAIAILMLSIIGAIIGYQAVSNWKWVAAASGAVIGIVTATLVTGFILMFLPQPVPLIGVEDSIAKYQRIFRRCNVLACFYFLWSTIWLAWIYFAVEDFIWDMVPLTLWLVGYGLLIYYIRVLDSWCCPSCGQYFAQQHLVRRLFHRFPHACRNCNFTIK